MVTVMPGQDVQLQTVFLPNNYGVRIKGIPYAWSEGQ